MSAMIRVGYQWKRQRGKGAWNRAELIRWLIETETDYTWAVPDLWRDTIEDWSDVLFDPIYFMDGNESTAVA